MTFGRYWNSGRKNTMNKKLTVIISSVAIFALTGLFLGGVSFVKNGEFPGLFSVTIDNEKLLVTVFRQTLL